MNETVKNILILLSGEKENYFLRTKIEEQMPRVKKKSHLKCFGTLDKAQKSQTRGTINLSTVYIYSYLSPRF